MILHGQDHPGLLTDLYELTMAAAYFESGKHEETASFELSIRSLPAPRSFLLAAGLEQAIQYFEGLRYSGDEIDFLRKHPAFETAKPAFFDFLAGLHFTGSVWAVPEGSVVFAEEPLLRVSAPIVQAQIAETYLLAMLTYQSSVATKAARMVRAARGRGIIEFGTRRAHGPRAGLLAARASYIGGCMGTSNVLAGYDLGVPVYGTSAHSWTMSFEDEEESFRQFAEIYGSKAILLVDTYDALEGTRKALSLRLPFRGVRVDSGDLLQTSRELRKILDAGGRPDALIVASSDLNEYSIARLVEEDAPIDLFGVGTDLVTSRDAPALSGIYKLVELSRDGRLRHTAKFSESKISYPGRKQIYRFSNSKGEFTRDVLALATEKLPDGEALLQPVMKNGKRIGTLPSLEQIRNLAAAQISRLPESVQRLENPESFPVEKSARLQDLLEAVRTRYVPQPAGTAAKSS